MSGALKSRIVIAYRDEGRGSGPFFDHYALQKATGYETAIALSSEMSTAALLSNTRLVTEAMPYGISNPAALDKLVPPVTDLKDLSDGLLVIPGRARDTEKKRPEVHKKRAEFQKNLIKDALLRGRPILGICAGSWDIWEYLGGTCKPVTAHCYRAGMPRILSSGLIGFNRQVHRVDIQASTCLASSISRTSTKPLIKFPVNSVHWQAPDKITLPEGVIISAYSVTEPRFTPFNSASADPGTVEAFEKKWGAPVMGIQWHPEAYNHSDKSEKYPDTQHSFLLYMAKAGDAYASKQKVLEELKKTF